MKRFRALLWAMLTLAGPLLGMAQTPQPIPGPTPPPIDGDGRLIVKLPTQCLQGTVVEVYDAQTNALVGTFTPNPLGIVDTGCSLPCPKKYIVKPVNPHCTFFPASKVVMVRCCPKVTKIAFKCVCGDNGGRIVVSVPPNCVQGTTVEILTASGALVMSGAPNASGLFDTGCKLKCPEKYVVKVSNPNCTFGPSYQIVGVPCCPEFVAVKFDCKCETPRGRIVAMADPSCPPGTYFEIRDSQGTLVASGPADAQGIFDTGCTLRCGVTYTVDAKNPTCPVTPATQQVFVPCCPDVARVVVKCDCPPPPRGRIKVFLPANCTSGTVVTITDVNTSQVVASGSPQIVQVQGTVAGLFDTSCTLVCGQTYVVTASNPDCTILPTGGQQVVAGCCPDASTVTFDCDCPPPPQPKGRIVVQVNGPCGPGSTVNITGFTNPSFSLTGTLDNQGHFDTGCVLDCTMVSVGYNVSVTSGTQQIGATVVYPPCCPSVATVTFDCPPQPNPCFPAPGGMVAWYPLDEPQGTLIAQDIAGSVQNTGTLSPAVPPNSVPGVVNGAFYFFGNYNYVEVQPHSELDFGSGSFSIDSWVNLVNCYPDRVWPIVEKYDVATSTGYSLFISNDQLQLTINGTTFASSPLGASYNQWYHVAVTVDRSSSSPVGTFWLNGSPVGTFTPPLSSVDNAQRLYIGRNYLVTHSAAPYCEIGIDELELFNTALTATDIAGIYQAGSAGKCKPNLGRLIGSSSPGWTHVEFQVFDAQGNLVYMGGPGSIDTGCTLFCNQSYTVNAFDTTTNPPTYFPPKTVSVPCCPQSASVFFP